MTELTYGQVQRNYRDHLKNASVDTKATIRVALQSNFTIDPFAAYLWSVAADEGVDVSVYCGPYDQYAQEFLAPDSGMYASKPHISFMIFGPGMESRAESIPDAVNTIINAFAINSDAALVISNLISPSTPFRLSRSADKIPVSLTNDALDIIAQNKPGVRILDIDGLASFLGKERITDHKLHYLGKIDFSHAFMTLLAKKCMTYIRLISSAPRKVLALDLDNTLWGGIVGEDGIDSISLSDSRAGQEFHDFQKEIKSLQERGVLLAICSKNNPEDALNAINNHPGMVLRESDFSAIRINWRNKDENIREIASELNLGTDSVVFLDDSPVERGIVKTALPEVAVPDLPGDPVLYATFIKHLDLFESFSNTEEDANRVKMYADQKKRDSAKNGFSSVEDYIRSLNITLSVSPVSDKSFSRACQLIMKTNQFNLTTRRHNENAVKSFMSSPDYELLALSVQDSFGDSGITGLAILRYESDKCVIDTLLLSCRILGRRIEETFISEIARRAAAKASFLTGEYIPTRKNEQVSSFYERMGFSNTSSTDNIVTYELDLSGKLPDPPNLHMLKVEEHK